MLPPWGVLRVVSRESLNLWNYVHRSLGLEGYMHVFGGVMVYIFYPVLKVTGDSKKVKIH